MIIDELALSLISIIIEDVFAARVCVKMLSFHQALNREPKQIKMMEARKLPTANLTFIETVQSDAIIVYMKIWRFATEKLYRISICGLMANRVLSCLMQWR